MVFLWLLWWVDWFNFSTGVWSQTFGKINWPDFLLVLVTTFGMPFPISLCPNISCTITKEEIFVWNIWVQSYVTVNTKLGSFQEQRAEQKLSRDANSCFLARVRLESRKCWLYSRKRACPPTPQRPSLCWCLDLSVVNNSSSEWAEAAAKYLCSQDTSQLISWSWFSFNLQKQCLQEMFLVYPRINEIRDWVLV